VNKKKQKNFIHLGALVSLPWAQISKSFCAAFFKKRLLALANRLTSHLSYRTARG
jgi:hypothetical protein